jgi:predicted Zn finger-like uncharacterized protein
MVVTCPACSSKLSIPDEKVPKDAVFTVTCPKCQGKIQASSKRPEAEAAPSPPPPAESVAPAAAPVESPPPTEEEEFVENRRLALVCLDQPQFQAMARTALAGLGYTVQVAVKPADALERMRQNRYEVLVLHEEYGGAAEGNVVLQAIQPMAMSLRRHLCVGLVGKQFRTFDHMTAFAKSVNFVVAERELSKLGGIVRQAATENDQFYRVFRESLREAGRQ